MDLTTTPEVAGEVLIPLKNGAFFPDKNIPSFQDINSCSYKNFRNVLFQGESLKFYIILKSSKLKHENISNFFDKILFKIDFEPNDIEKNLNINENGEEMIEINKDKDVYFYSTNKISKEKNKNENEFEEVNNKIYDEKMKMNLKKLIIKYMMKNQKVKFMKSLKK